MDIEGIVIWSTVALAAVCIGFCCAKLIKNSRNAFIAAATIPPLIFLGFCLFSEYVLPYRGGGASMWPIALFVSSMVTVPSSLLSCYLYMRWVGKHTK